VLLSMVEYAAERTWFEALSPKIKFASISRSTVAMSIVRIYPTGPFHCATAPLRRSALYYKPKNERKKSIYKVRKFLLLYFV